MYKIPIGGGPNSGKSTLAEAVHKIFPNSYPVNEPAERVIKREKAKEAETPGYQGIFPRTNYPAFLPLVIAESLELEAAIPSDAKLVIQDRCLIDNIGYGTYYQYENMFPMLRRYIEAARYTIALFCDPVGEYQVTEVRHETAAEAADIQQHLAIAYDNSDIPVVHLPDIGLANRLEIVIDTIANL
jgi:predicted ATPase